MGTQAKVIAFRNNETIEKAETNFHATAQVVARRSRSFFALLCIIFGALCGIGIFQPNEPALEGKHRFLLPGQENAAATALAQKIATIGTPTDTPIAAQSPYTSLPLMSESQQKELMYWMDYYASEPGSTDRPMPAALQRWVRQNIAQNQQAQIQSLFTEYRSYWVERQARPARPKAEQANVASVDKAQWVWLGE